MNCHAWVSVVVVLACLSTHACGSDPPNPSGPSPEGTDAEPNAADLVREIRAGEDWLHRIDSLRIRARSVWRHPPESIAAYAAQRRKRDPNWAPNPEHDEYLRPSFTDTLEYIVDFRQKRLRSVADTPHREYLLRIWDANQLTQYVRLADGYEQYDLESTTHKFQGLFDHMSWPRAQGHSFWWDTRDMERFADYFGAAADFRLAGRADYRGVPCHVLERTLRGEPTHSHRWYVGTDDHLLYGRREYYGGQCRVEHWTLDYRTVAPGCRMPMTQGYILTGYDPDKNETYTSLHRDLKVVEVRVNENLPDALFRMEFVEGLYVVDSRSGRTVVSKYVATPPSLVGRLLPDTASLGIDPAAGRRILLCFVDLNQRPSRHCLTQLAAVHEQLHERGVMVAAVDVSEMDRESLSRRGREQKIPFALGKADADLRQMRQTWGIRSLPWLILADAEHIVRAEGFAVRELDQKVGTQMEK